MKKKMSTNKMSSNNQLALVVSYYLSKYDKLALNRLGYKTWKYAFKDISDRLDVKENTVKNMRDDFDSVNPNSRVGWYKRELRSSRLEIINKYNNKSEEELYEIVNKILNKNYNLKNESIENSINIKEIDGKTQSLRMVTSETIAFFNNEKDEYLKKEHIFDLSEGIEERERRRKEHQNLVQNLALYLERQDYKLYEGQIDCLAIKDDVALIFEVKTLNGDKKDERAQVLKALSQLKYYKKFCMGQFSNLNNIYLISVFSKILDNKYIEFLKENNIDVIYEQNNTLVKVL